MKKRRLLSFIVGFGFAVVCFVAINAAMAPMSTSAYCGSECHEIGTAYQTWQLSPHGGNKYGFRVECVDCHLPAKDKYFRNITAKAIDGGKDVFYHYFGDEYDVEEMRKKVLAAMPNDRCQSCHDDLLARPSGQAARTAHLAVVADPDNSEHRCVQCHENVGHERVSKIFVPH